MDFLLDYRAAGGDHREPLMIVGVKSSREARSMLFRIIKGNVVKGDVDD